MLTDQRSSHPALSMADGIAMTTGDFLLLAGRILLGWIFVRSGYGKLFDISAVAASYPGRGIPYWMAWIAVPSEFFGGLALMFGFAVRYVIGIMLIFMVVRHSARTPTGISPTRRSAASRTVRSGRTSRSSAEFCFCS